VPDAGNRRRRGTASLAAVLAFSVLGLTLRAIAALVPGAAFGLAGLIATALFVLVALALGYFLAGASWR
jgi:hypothetical protein